MGIALNIEIVLLFVFNVTTIISVINNVLPVSIIFFDQVDLLYNEFVMSGFQCFGTSPCVILLIYFLVWSINGHRKLLFQNILVTCFYFFLTSVDIAINLLHSNQSVKIISGTRIITRNSFSLIMRELHVVFLLQKSSARITRYMSQKNS